MVLTRQIDEVRTMRPRNPLAPNQFHWRRLAQVSAAVLPGIASCAILERMFTSVAPSAATDAARGLRGLIDAVNGLDTDGCDAALIDRITELEQLKSVCAAAQARLTHTFPISQQTDGAARKVDADITRRSIAAQIALAR